jgi:hypothetical protein
MLKITGDGRKAALDMRLVEPFGEPEPDTKLTLAVQRIKSVWTETRDARSTQLVFCDLSTPNPASFNVYDEVRSKLMEAGVPPDEIAFIHDADSDADKKTLFDNVNAGRIRILIGSTEKMGAGTNVQKRLAALHHLDAPWRPRDIEQREGRILRQGNLNSEIRIFRYVTEGSFDAYMWQLTGQSRGPHPAASHEKRYSFQLRFLIGEARTPLRPQILARSTPARSPHGYDSLYPTFLRADQPGNWLGRRLCRGHSAPMPGL